MDHCLNCGGAIGEPGKAYGYAGKWCYCPVNPATPYRRPANYSEASVALKKAGYSEREIAYAPWVEMGLSEVEYWKKRYIEARQEVAVFELSAERGPSEEEFRAAMTDKQKSPEEVAREIVQDWSGWDQDDMSDTLTQDLIKRISQALAEAASKQSRLVEALRKECEAAWKYRHSSSTEYDAARANRLRVEGDEG